MRLRLLYESLSDLSKLRVNPLEVGYTEDEVIKLLQPRIEKMAHKYYDKLDPVTGAGGDVDDIISLLNMALLNILRSGRYNGSTPWLHYVLSTLKKTKYSSRKRGRLIHNPIRDLPLTINDPIEVTDKFFDSLVSGDMSPIETLEDKESRKLVKKYVDALLNYDKKYPITQRQEQVLKMSFGFEMEEPLGPTEIAKKLGVTPMRIREILNDIFKKVRKAHKEMKNMNPDFVSQVGRALDRSFEGIGTFLY